MGAAAAFLIVTSLEKIEKSSEGMLLRVPFPTSGAEHLGWDYFASNLQFLTATLRTKKINLYNNLREKLMCKFCYFKV